MSYEIVRKEVTNSTNDDAKNSILGHGTVYTAEIQTQGRGRCGKTFYSPAKSGLYMSVVIRKIPKNIDRITPVIAVIVMRAINEIYGVKLAIKWVNDLMLEGKKVCGILCESVINEDGVIEKIVAGIGINITSNALPNELKDIATGLTHSLNLDKRERLLRLIQEKIAAEDFLDVAIYRDEYMKNCINIGKKITLFNKEPYEAECVGIGEDFALLIKRDGEYHSIKAGEVSISNQPLHLKAR